MLQAGFIVALGILAGWALYSLFAAYGFYAHFDVPLMIIMLLCAGVFVYLSKSAKIRLLFQLSDMIILEKWISNFLVSNSVYKSQEEVQESIIKAVKEGLSIEKIQLLWKDEIKKYPELCKKLKYSNKKQIPILSKKESKNAQEDGEKIQHLAEMENLGELFIPIYIEKELNYILIFSEKKSQDSYTKNEKKLINTMRPKIRLSMQILEYNRTLREEVKSQTLQINEQKIKLEESYKKLEALDHEKDIFMNMAAHELRTPMTIIRWYADILLDWWSGEMNIGQKKLVQNMFKSSESLIALVNDLLDLSRIDAWKMELKYEKCHLVELTQNTFENFQTLMIKKNMDFKLEENINKNIEFITDKSKLTLLFNNLISNAYKYTPEAGEVTWKIKTIMKNTVPWVTLSVTDTGVGIPEAEVSRVFDRFANISTHNDIASTIQSTGLGLSIVKKIVTWMGGIIGVESTVGKWSTFTIELPYNPKKQSVKKLVTTN